MLCIYLYVLSPRPPSPLPFFLGHVKPNDSNKASCPPTISRSGNEDAWVPLRWNLSHAAEQAIIAAKANLLALALDLDLRVVSYGKYGKDFVKKCSVSPDAYVQLAMQLAYYQDQNRHDATYESSMTRLFLHGRTGEFENLGRE
jgi:hypothetical protein